VRNPVPDRRERGTPHQRPSPPADLPWCLLRRQRGHLTTAPRPLLNSRCHQPPRFAFRGPMHASTVDVAYGATAPRSRAHVGVCGDVRTPRPCELDVAPRRTRNCVTQGTRPQLLRPQGRLRVRGTPTTTRESPTTAAPAGCFGCKGCCGVLVRVDPHPRRVGTKIMRVRSASRHKNEKVSLEAENRPSLSSNTSQLEVPLPLAAALAAARGRRGGHGRVWSSGHARTVAETASCRLGSRRSRRRPRLQLFRRPKAGRQATDRLGKVSLGRLCVCVSGSVGRVWSCGRPSPVLVVWGGSPASSWLVFSIFPGKEKSLSALLSCQAANLGSCPCACWHVSSVKCPLVRHVPLSSSSSPWLARDSQSVWRVRTLLVVDYAHELGVRGALFSLFVAVACFSCLN